MTEAEFVETALSNPINHAILARLPQLELSDAWLVSGALFQTIWNVITERPPDYGIKDYDIFYFDGDTSWETEDRIIRRTEQVTRDLDCDIQIRNQARVHLWYEEKFGMPYPPLRSASEGIDRFLMQNAQVGMQPKGETFEIYAPQGFADIEALIVRPNFTPNFREALYFEKAACWKTLWPELTIVPPH